MMKEVRYRNLKRKYARRVAKAWQESTHADRDSQAYILWSWRRGGLALLVSGTKLKTLTKT